MAQCKQTPQEFIRNGFTPQIAVVCTPMAERACQKNHLNFIELLQPFLRLQNDVHFKDPLGLVWTVKNLKLSFSNVNTRPPQTTLARKFLNSSVSEFSEFKTETVITGTQALNITLNTPWFEAWRETFLNVQYPSDHEYTKHFLSCVLVVSSADTNPIESIMQLSQNLNQMHSTAPGKLPKWFSSNILKFYTIIHDNSEGNLDAANDAYESLKNSYGEANCFLLKMNSRPLGFANNEHLPDPWSQFINSNIESKDYKITPETSPYASRASFDSTHDVDSKNALSYHPLSPDTEELTMSTSSEKDRYSLEDLKQKVHGLCLSTEDIEQVKLFLHEFSKLCLLPYIEKQIQQLSDVISNKKGVSRSLFSATKRWFNPNKPGASSVAVNNLIYAPDSPELQIRRLGDLYFMFGHYTLAFQAYHLAKRDYNTDQAWLYYAGALEMAALSAYMANESNRKTYDYMEESITTYLNTCKLPQFATRATLLSSECLKSRGLYGEAAHQLIRMTSEDSDLRSALFLEQAAYCFLHSKMIRKYAFHMVLAGHRFSKAAQRKHSLRSYKQAHQIYQNSGWDLAEDHIHYTIGRQAHNLHSFDEAVKSFAKLLKGDSKQSGQQQSVFLKEYLTILGNKVLKEGNNETPILVLPGLDNEGLKLLMEPTPPLKTPGKSPALGINFNDDETFEIVEKWLKLEELLVQEAQGLSLLTFKPIITLYKTENLMKNVATAIVNESIQFSIKLENSLQIVLQLKDIYLLWSFETEKGVFTNENCETSVDSIMKTHIFKTILIQTNCKQNIVLSLTPLITGTICLKGICYTLSSSDTPTDNIFIKGKQLFNFNNLESNLLENGVTIRVVPFAPCLQVTFSQVHSEFLCDEIQRVNVDFYNIGTLPLQKILFGTSNPHLLHSGAMQPDRDAYSYTNLTATQREKIIRENHITSVVLPDGQLAPGETTSAVIYIKAPNKPGNCDIDLLIYYENTNPELVPRYRLVRHKWKLKIVESIEIQASIHPSYNSKKNEEIAFVLHAENLNREHNSIMTEISLINVGMFSKYWSFSNELVTPKYIKLQSQESANILLKACRISEDKSQFSNINFNFDKSFENYLSSVVKAFAKQSENYQINLFDDNAFIAKTNSDGIIFVQWQALMKGKNARVINGQTQITFIVYKKEESQEIDDFGSLLSDPASILEYSINKDKYSKLVASDETKVSCTLLYPPVIQHDFCKQKLCVVPVNLLIHSLVSDATLTTTINTLGTPSSFSSQPELFSPYASKNFSWLGTGAAVRELSPLSTVLVALFAIVSKPGTFDIGARIEIFCTLETSDVPIRQTCRTQSALIVIDEDR